MKRAVLLLVITMTTAACNERAAVQNASASPGVVDSIFPVEADIRRFKAELRGSAPTHLEGGAESKEALATGFIRALETSDTVALRDMVLTSWEFIELYYPYSAYTKPPYKQSPRLMWFLMEQNSEKGISRALTRFGGKPTGYRGLACSDAPVVQGANRIWERCQVRWDAAPEKPDGILLFGSILERGGHFKFISYANDL
jgi:hypothetical protein